MRTYRTLAAVAAGLALAAITSPASASVNHEANRPSYWQTDTTTCTKVEVTGSLSTWTLPAPVDGSSYALLVLKAGTVNDVFVAPVAGLAYAPASGKDISHVIVCVGTDGGGVVYY